MTGPADDPDVDTGDGKAGDGEQGRDVAPTLDPYDLSHDDLAALLGEWGQPSYRATQVAEWLDRGVDDPAEMTNLPTDLRERLEARFGPTRPRLVDHRVADGGRTHKLLLEYHDGVAIETVLMLYPDRATVCISTQAGCAMGCPFCATGQAGFRRQLTTGEVVRQVMVAHAALQSGGLSGAALRGGDGSDGGEGGELGEVEPDPATAPDDGLVAGDLALPDGHPDRVTNVVFMGMGEPLANVGATLGTIDYLHERLGLSARNITVSTVGLVPAIRRLARHGKPVTLAVSLHAADDDLRDDLVPPNRQHPLASVEAAMQDYRETTNRRVSIEWCLIGDVNDADDQARGLAAIARRTRSHVNVIPMNPTPGVRWKEPSGAAIRRFMGTLESAGANATLRDTRGRDADAACGQLLASYTLGQGARLPVAVGAAERVDARRPGGGDGVGDGTADAPTGDEPADGGTR